MHMNKSQGPTTVDIDYKSILTILYNILKYIKAGAHNVLVDPAVEISLYKHLLYEGMGVAAASQAFDAKKLDMDKFASLSPDMLKKDNIVVRIRGHYFPWDAAAPIVLGLLSLELLIIWIHV
ncbi:unnamed protein product, partial [Vitis vinifera]